MLQEVSLWHLRNSRKILFCTRAHWLKQVTKFFEVKIVYFTSVAPPEHLKRVLIHHHIPQIWVKPGCVKSPRKADLDLLQRWDYVFTLSSLPAIFKTSPFSTRRQEKNSRDLQKIIKPRPGIAILSQRRRFLCPRDPESCRVRSTKLLVHSESPGRDLLALMWRGAKDKAKYPYSGGVGA